ncbi:hypothetical protein ElyMa_004631700 [Elysia marginata]|uniref:Uncharacterized protein n=1 Tax=Elysia marginata TaxID=1093978 RepID=A0AAV4HYW0_9GAST|nr:hypothetical protein ElyMa_004631700 [Elysia marginata]
MKPELDPLFPDKSGCDNDIDNNIDNGENPYEEPDEMSRLMVSAEPSPVPVETELGNVQATATPTTSDPDGLMIPLIKYQRPAIARSISAGSGGAPAKKKHGGGKGHQQAPPNGTLNVSLAWEACFCLLTVVVAVVVVSLVVHGLAVAKLFDVMLLLWLLLLLLSLLAWRYED